MRQSLYPVTLEDLKASPAIREHWPHVGRLIEGFLLTTMAETAAQHECGAKSGDESAALKTIAAIIKLLEPLSVKTGESEPRPMMKPLKRFSKTPPEEAKPETKNPTAKQ